MLKNDPYTVGLPPACSKHQNIEIKHCKKERERDQSTNQSAQSMTPIEDGETWNIRNYFSSGNGHSVCQWKLIAIIAALLLLSP